MRGLHDDNFVHKVLGLTEGNLENIHLIGEEDHQDNPGWTAASVACQPILTSTIWPEISKTSKVSNIKLKVGVIYLKAFLSLKYVTLLRADYYQTFVQDQVESM